jgi:hypothetical protein
MRSTRLAAVRLHGPDGDVNIDLLPEAVEDRHQAVDR